MKKTIGICWFVGWVALASAQPVSALLKNAAQEQKAGHYLAAAELWERAGRLKNGEPEYLFQAAEAYAQVRDYRRAADCYKPVLDDPRYPLAGLRYARALKQQGRYEEALAAFETFADAYRGAEKAIVMSVVENEIAGCVMATQDHKNQDTTLIFRALPDSVNSSENEFAPVPFSEKLLYFSSASAERAKLMRVLWKSGAWKDVAPANALPDEVSATFRSGCFSSDGSRFYYAACKDGCSAQTGGSARGVSCALYCMRRTEQGWANPERLRPYINMEGSSALFPQVARASGKEYLFFSSDRAGGFGGMDLYVCEREIEADELDFSFPQNLGPQINTGADEVTPFFDTESETLWFSSIGHPSIGGLDVFKSLREENGWSKPENAGLPINSPADDAFFVRKRNGAGAFLSSNRIRDEQAPVTLDDNLFEIVFPDN